MSTRCCWIRPAPLRWATGRRSSLFPWPASRPKRLPTRRNLRAWPTRRPRAAPSWCWRKRRMAFAGAKSRSTKRTFIPFTAQTRMSGVDIDGRCIRKGATESVCEFVQEHGGDDPRRTGDYHQPHFALGRYAAGGGRPRTRAGRGSPEGRGQGRHARPLRATPRDGHPHRDDHRR